MCYCKGVIEPQHLLLVCYLSTEREQLLSKPNNILNTRHSPVFFIFDMLKTFEVC